MKKTSTAIKVAFVLMLLINVTAVKAQTGLTKAWDAFFENKNNNPILLMEMATWWIKENELDHFEKATKIKQMMEEIKSIS